MRSPLINEYLSEHRHLDAHVEGRVTVLWRKPKQRFSFGEAVTTIAYDKTSFRLITEVSVSQTFFGWVFGFGGKVHILAPESVKERYRQMVQNEVDTLNKGQEQN